MVRSVSLAKVLNSYYEAAACIAQKDQIGDIKNLMYSIFLILNNRFIGYFQIMILE